MVNFLWWKPDQHPEAYSELCLISKMGRFAKFSSPNTVIPPNMNPFKVNNRRIRKRCENCSKLPIRTSERRHYPSSGVFIVNFEQLYVWQPKYSHIQLLYRNIMNKKGLNKKEILLNLCNVFFIFIFNKLYLFA